MKRRGFFVTVLGALCAPFLPKVKPAGLMFHKDAFALAMEPLNYPVVFDWPAIEAVQRPATELFVVSGGKGYAWSADDLEERRRSGLPMLDAEAIDRG